MILINYFVTVARILVTVNEMSLFNMFSVLLVKTDCMMVSKMGATWIKISYYMFFQFSSSSCDQHTLSTLSHRIF